MCKPEYKDSQLVIIDYLQLIGACMTREGYEFESRMQEVEYISRELKLMAMEKKVPVIVLSQLGRGCEKRSDHHPMITDLREGRATVDMADVVMLLYRDEYYDPDTDIKNIAEINVAKNRYGYTSHIDLGYLPEYTGFLNLVRTESVTNPN